METPERMVSLVKTARRVRTRSKTYQPTTRNGASTAPRRLLDLRAVRVLPVREDCRVQTETTVLLVLAEVQDPLGHQDSSANPDNKALKARRVFRAH
jgi:hypothetical protein